MVVITGMQGEPAVAEADMTLQKHEACRVFSGEVVPGSRDPGSGGLHRFPGWGAWIVTCACTQDSWWQRWQR